MLRRRESLAYLKPQQTVELSDLNQKFNDSLASTRNLQTNNFLNVIEITYSGKRIILPQMYKYGNPHIKTMLNDTIIDFYLSDWLRNERYDEETRRRVCTYSTFHFASIKKRFEANIQHPPRRSDLISLHKTMFKKADISIFTNDLLIVPVHIENPAHWILVLIHNPRGAIYQKISVDEKTDSTSFSHCINRFLVEEKPRCRILIMDSLVNESKFTNILNEHHKKIGETLRLWLQMIAAAANLEMLSSRIDIIICKDLPRQFNSYDCGLYLLVFAEYFSYWNTEWMSFSTEELCSLRVDESLELDLKTEAVRKRLAHLLEFLKTR